MQVNPNVRFNRFATRILYGYIMLGPGSRDGFVYGSKANGGHLTEFVHNCFEVHSIYLADASWRF